jgi:hypothetical protein
MKKRTLLQSIEQSPAFSLLVVRDFGCTTKRSLLHRQLLHVRKNMNELQKGNCKASTGWRENRRSGQEEQVPDQHLMGEESKMLRLV